MKVAIYARYSSDNQRDASVEDQLRICRAFVARQPGWIIVGEFDDRALSGATMLRPGLQAMLREALARRVDVVLAESLDRFSRDVEDTAGLFKRLTFAGVDIVTVSEGDITSLHIGFKGTMNALYLKDLAEKTRRGNLGCVEAGKSGGGKSYGYKVVAVGRLEVVEAEAAIVRRIFREYADGARTEGHREAAERRGHPWSAGRVVTVDDSRPCYSRDRPAE